MQKIGKTRDGVPDAESWNAIITLTNKGSKRAVIRSGHLEKYQQRQYILLDQNVDADFFNSEEIYTSNLKSNIAEIDEAKDFLVAMGNVVVVSDRDADAGLLVKVIDQSRLAGASNVSLAAQK